MSKSQKSVYFFLSIIAIAFSCKQREEGQINEPELEVAETHDTKVKNIVNEIADIFNSAYVFEDVANNIHTVLTDNLASGRYSDIPLDSLAKLLEFDLIQLTNDKHISIEYSDSNDQLLTDFDQFENYGFSKIDTLENNIGLIELSIFSPTRGGKSSEVAHNAMQSLRTCSGLIFDLRNCKGGDPSMLVLLTSYLFPKGKKIHLNDLYFRSFNDTTSFYTLEDFDGDILNIPVVVLTSPTTFSCAEEFAYDLKHLGRATIIGETTGGGANPVMDMSASYNFDLRVPVGTAINPITKTNWEGVGVVPDINVKAESALQRAIDFLKNR